MSDFYMVEYRYISLNCKQGVDNKFRIDPSLLLILNNINRMLRVPVRARRYNFIR